MKRVLVLLWRLIVTGTVSVLVVFLAFRLYGELKMPERPAPLSIDPTVAKGIERAVTETAANFKIPAPAIAYEDSLIPGFTLCVEAPGAPPKCTIHLGRFVNQLHFNAHPEDLLAIVKHETGHAIQQHRNQAVSGYWTIFAAIVGFWIALFCWATTWRHILTCGALGILFFGGASALPGSSLGLPGAFVSMMLAAALVFALAGPKRPAWQRCISSLPGLAAVAVFVGVSYQNHGNEKHADLVAACQDGSVRPMQHGLENITVEKGWARKVADAWLDPLHPTTDRRIAALGRLAEPGALARQCARLHDGSFVTVAGEY